MPYTHIRIKQEYRERLAKLASSHNRSMANMVEVLIEQAELQLPVGSEVEGDIVL